jgi:hypothetical protein
VPAVELATIWSVDLVSSTRRQLTAALAVARSGLKRARPVSRRLDIELPERRQRSTH